MSLFNLKLKICYIISLKKIVAYLSSEVSPGGASGLENVSSAVVGMMKRLSLSNF